jgi:hypothetical protein
MKFCLGMQRAGRGGLSNRLRILLHHQIRGAGAGQVCRGHQVREAAGGDLRRRLHLRGGAGGVSRQGPHLYCGCAGGGLRSEPPEDLQVYYQAGAQSVARAGVHHRAQGDLHAQVHHSPAGQSEKEKESRGVVAESSNIDRA